MRGESHLAENALFMTFGGYRATQPWFSMKISTFLGWFNFDDPIKRLRLSQ